MLHNVVEAIAAVASVHSSNVTIIKFVSFFIILAIFLALFGTAVLLTVIDREKFSIIHVLHDASIVMIGDGHQNDVVIDLLNESFMVTHESPVKHLLLEIFQNEPIVCELGLPVLDDAEHVSQVGPHANMLVKLKTVLLPALEREQQDPGDLVVDIRQNRRLGLQLEIPPAREQRAQAATAIKVEDVVEGVEVCPPLHLPEEIQLAGSKIDAELVGGEVGKEADVVSEDDVELNTQHVRHGMLVRGDDDAVVTVISALLLQGDLELGDVALEVSNHGLEQIGFVLLLAVHVEVDVGCAGDEGVLVKGHSIGVEVELEVILVEILKLLLEKLILCHDVLGDELATHDATEGVNVGLRRDEVLLLVIIAPGSQHRDDLSSHDCSGLRSLVDVDRLCNAAHPF